MRRVKLERAWGALGLLGRAVARRLERQDRALRRVVVVPVPLAAARRRERGFNQAFELARFVGRRLAVPVLQDALVRVRETLPQGSVFVDSRRRNVEGAFALGRAGKELSGREALLVDDVVTSGATLRECARVLRRDAGVRAVEGIVACTARA